MQRPPRKLRLLRNVGGLREAAWRTACGVHERNQDGGLPRVTLNPLTALAPCEVSRRETQLRRGVATAGRDVFFDQARPARDSKKHRDRPLQPAARVTNPKGIDAKAIKR